MSSIREKSDEQVLAEAIEKFDKGAAYWRTHIELPVDVARRILEALRRP